jgi:mycofactocin precursor
MTDSQSVAQDQSTEQPLVAEDLIEEVSIDGMCGVY